MVTIPRVSLHQSLGLAWVWVRGIVEKTKHHQKVSLPNFSWHQGLKAQRSKMTCWSSSGMEDEHFPGLLHGSDLRISSEALCLYSQGWRYQHAAPVGAWLPGEGASWTRDDNCPLLQPLALQSFQESWLRVWETPSRGLGGKAQEGLIPIKAQFSGPISSTNSISTSMHLLEANKLCIISLKDYWDIYLGEQDQTCKLPPSPPHH